MSSRWPVTAFLVAFAAITPVIAQTTTPPPYPGYGPVVVNNVGGPDPYANVMAPPGGWWMPSSLTVADRLWVRAEYLYWDTSGMDVPALVTTSPEGTPQDQAAILGEPGVSVLFGGGDLNGDAVGGLRARAGFWLNPMGTIAIESEFFTLESQGDGISRSSDGSTILGRPFFDIVNGRQTAELVSFPGVVSGRVQVGSDTDLRSFLLNGRVGMCPPSACYPCGDTDRVDWIVGYRYLKLSDSLSFGEDLTSLVTSAPGTIAIREGFSTDNEFNGVQFGVTYLANFERAWLESMIRVAAGNTRQTVGISGGTEITEDDVTEQYQGGLLAQRTNIGNYQRDQFMLIPELGLTFGVRVFDWLDATVGYSVLYFPSVVRAGDQIDTDINPNLLPPEVDPITGALRPQFRFVESDYFAHGLSLGAELRF